ncbi:peptide-methionine (S)-S-oxide reductase, partial [Escherichia coli]|uniref:peptide-methionine (S)-S-oxide reductase n=1 Tax=Escherichia coli TaxID=562 RepID=UPI001573855E
MAANSSNSKLETATLAGGCFWCTEAPYDELEGVEAAISGYTNGTKEDATYEKVSSGTTAHYEAVQVTFDPSVSDYNKILDVF